MGKGILSYKEKERRRMSFIQIHELVSYPASNLNRDDLNRPKTVTIGNTTRLRISSQSLKRAWRTSTIMGDAFPDLSIRTRVLAETITNALIKGNTLFDEIKHINNQVRQPIDEKKAKKWGDDIDSCFRPKKDDKSNNNNSDGKEPTKEKKKQIIACSYNELMAIDHAMDEISKGNEPDISNLMRDEKFSADIAMFGRMVADSQKNSCEAAVQVAHAFTVHRTVVEDDYFTAVDDLATSEGGGAGHIDVQNFGAGLYYQYICIDTALLERNIGSTDAAKKAITALIEASIKVPPSGKQNSYASRSYASYILVEKGAQQPRSLAAAFLKPISGEDVLRNSIDALKKLKGDMDRAFGKCNDEECEIDVTAGEGKTFDDLIEFIG